MAKRQFKAESKRLLDLMVNSIYTHKEIFLREIISNASDACDKLCYQALTDDAVGMSRKDFKIEIKVDKEHRTLTVSDNGIGMDKEDLENNLGVIASSGSYKFKQEVGDDTKDTDVIGQFGVGFYSAFMVADHVTVTSRAYGSDEAWQWASDGADGYTLTPCEKESAGTDIVLHIKQNTEDDHYDEYLEQYRLADLVKKYSDYIHYPIVMLMHKSRQKPRPEDAGDDYKPEWEDFDEWETLNSMVPLWQRPKSEVTAEEYNQFYKEKYGDWEDPLSVVHVSAEGAVEYKAMLYIPAHAPYDFHSREYQKGLQLYSSGVLIMDKCADLLPEHFRFVKGVVDSQDFSLNISREMLQHTRQLKVIAGNLEKKIKAELLRLQKDDREKYETFWKAFGTQIKVGVVSDYGAHKELLKDLLLFFSSKEGKLTSLAEYKARMPEEQKYIYYACGEDAGKLAKLPQAERILDAGYEILFLTEDVDEFCMMAMGTYGEHAVDGDEENKQPYFIKNVGSEDLGLTTDEEKKEAEEATESNAELFDVMREALGEKVERVVVSTRLTDAPAVVTSEGGVSLAMVQVLKSQPGAEGLPDLHLVLEMNAKHPVFEALRAAHEAGDDDKVRTYAGILFDQALLVEGVMPDNPLAFAQAVSELMK